MLENLQKLKISKSIVFLCKKVVARGGMQCDSRSKIELEIAVSKTSKKRGPLCPYKKNLNNSFLTQLHYNIIISKLLNKVYASIFYDYFINWP